MWIQYLALVACILRVIPNSKPDYPTIIPCTPEDDVTGKRKWASGIALGANNLPKRTINNLFPRSVPAPNKLITHGECTWITKTVSSLHRLNFQQIHQLLRPSNASWRRDRYKDGWAPTNQPSLKSMSLEEKAKKSHKKITWLGAGLLRFRSKFHFRLDIERMVYLF